MATITATTTRTAIEAATPRILHLSARKETTLLAEIGAFPLDEREREAFEFAKSKIKTEPAKAYTMIIARVLQGLIARRGMRALPKFFQLETEFKVLLQEKLPLGKSVEDFIARFKGARDVISTIDAQANAIASVFEELIAELYREAESVRSKIRDDSAATRDAFVALDASRVARVAELNKTFHGLRTEASAEIAKSGAAAKGVMSAIEKAQGASDRYAAAARSVADITRSIRK